MAERRSPKPQVGGSRPSSPAKPVKTKMKNPFSAIRIFWGETVGELKKASWPTRKELKESTIVVIIGIVLLGFYVGIVDFSLKEVVNLFSTWAQYGIGH